VSKQSDEVVKRVLQVLAILLLAAIVLTILHKGYTDMATLARAHRGDDFWMAFLRYVFRNLAGG
jgi:hypothetical protein